MPEAQLVLTDIIVDLTRIECAAGRPYRESHPERMPGEKTREKKAP